MAKVKKTMDQKLPKDFLLFIFYFLKPYKWHLLGFVIPMLYAALHLSLEPYVLKLLIDQVIQKNNNNAEFSQISSEAIYLTIILIVLGFLILISWRVKDYVAIKIFPTMKASIIEELFEVLSLHSHRFYQENFAGNIANKIQEVSLAVENLIEDSREIFKNIASAFIAIFMMLTVHWSLSIVLFIWCVVFISTGFFLSKKINSFSESFAEARSIAFGKIVDSITNQSNVRLFSRNRFEVKFLKKFLYITSIQDKKLRKEFIKLWTWLGIIACSMVGIVIYSLIFLKSRNLISPGDFAFVTWVAIALIDQIWPLTELLSKMPLHIGACNQALSLIQVPYEVVDIPHAKQLLVTQGSIEFRNVTFSHLSAQEEHLYENIVSRKSKNSNGLFKNLSLNILSGSKVGLVGYSGSGKTTFVQLIVRLYNLDQGQILVDGQDISQVTQNSLRENIGFIPQDPALFHRSLKENIQYGKMDATDLEVEQAARRAHAHHFILSTPQGYQSLVGERGLKLSGGQRQRITIARALLKNAPILILDEATSSLDSITEELIQEALDELMQNKTALVIAHRLSTLLSMDRILVFDQGKIVQDGTHKELLLKKGLYQSLWNNQVGGFIQE